MRRHEVPFAVQPDPASYFTGLGYILHRRWYKKGVPSEELLERPASPPYQYQMGLVMKSSKRAVHQNLHVDLPLEIWLEYFSELSSTDLKSLSLTCRLFNDATLPIIFRSITYTSHITCGKKQALEEIKEQLDNVHRNVKALKGISESSRHAPFVKKCVLQYFLRIAPRADKKAVKTANKSYHAFVDMFVTCLPRFFNLRKLEVTKFMARMDKRILDGLARHPSLVEVSLSGVSFGAHLLKPRIRLQRLSIDNRDHLDSNPNSAANVLDIFSGEILESLCSWTTAYSPKLFRGLVKQGNLDSLVHLSYLIKPSQVSDLYAFLSSCSNVEFIQMGLQREFGYFDTAPLPPLPLSAVPRLKSFSGPDMAAVAFLPGRPVRTIEVRGGTYGAHWLLYHEPIRVFTLLSQGVLPVIELNIQTYSTAPDGVGLNTIAEYFPSLEVLNLSLAKPDVWVNGDDALQGLDSELSNAYDDAIGGELEMKRSSHFCSVHVHTDYMNLLRSVNCRKSRLPANIKSLSLQYDIVLEFEEVDLLGMDLQAESDYIRLHGTPYTANAAQEVFQNLSASYTALQSLVISPELCGGLRWVRERDGRWSYDTAFSFSDFQEILLKSSGNQSTLRKNLALLVGSSNS